MRPFALIAAALILSACQPAERAETPAAAPAAAPVMPADAPPQEDAPEAVQTPSGGQGIAVGEPNPAAPGPCSAAIGEAAAKALVDRCIAVSPATHPPCNVANPCAMIQNEIDRSCGLWERQGDAPGECRR